MAIEKHYPPRQAAEYLAERGAPFSVGTLNTWRHYGRGPAYKKIANRILYPQAALDQFIESVPMVKTVDSIG